MYNNYPKQLGFFFPPEWDLHEAVWISWIHKTDTFLNNFDKVILQYSEFIREVSKSEIVRINVCNEFMKENVVKYFNQININTSKIEFYIHPTNDTWCRDYGFSFLVNSNRTKKIIVNWEFNSWGNKYPPFDLDNNIAFLVSKILNISIINSNIIMEGGSVEFNGKGSILTSRSCLLNKNRNPHLNQKQIEEILCNYYGQEEVLWISHGIIGDDTDGHIDCVARFVNYNTVLAVVEDNKYDQNHTVLSQNLKELKKIKLLNRESLNIIELPMPKPLFYKNKRLPASYANFYIANHAVIVPIFNNENDDKALNIIQSCFPNRKIIGLDSSDIILGLGSFHCLTQQEPKIY